MNSVQYNTSQSLYALHHAEHLPIELDENRSRCFGEVQAPTARLGWDVPWQKDRNDRNDRETPRPGMSSRRHAPPTWRSKVWSRHELYQCRWLRLSSTWKKGEGAARIFSKTNEIVLSFIFLGQNAQAQKGSNIIQQVSITAVWHHILKGY